MIEHEYRDSFALTIQHENWNSVLLALDHVYWHSVVLTVEYIFWKSVDLLIFILAYQIWWTLILQCYSYMYIFRFLCLSRFRIMSTTKFVSSLLIQTPSASASPISEYNKAALVVKELMIESNWTAVIIVLDRSKFVHMVVAPDIQKEDDSTLQQVFVRLSDTKSVPGSLSPAVFKHHIGVATRLEIPDFAFKGQALTT